MITIDSPKISQALYKVSVPVYKVYFAQKFPYYMLALCSMLLPSYYAQNYADIIASSLFIIGQW